MAAHRFRIVFHWVTFLLVAAAYAIAFYRSGIDDPDLRLFWLDVHRAIGLTLLGFTLLRLLGRIVLPFERIHEQNPVLHLLAQINHTLLYVGLLAMPLLGWAQSSAKMHKFKLFDTQLPALVKHNTELGDQLAQWHETLGWAILALIGMHSAAALYHHFIRRDPVLINMLRVQAAE